MANSIEKTKYQTKLKIVHANDNESANTISEYKSPYNIYKSLPKIVFIFIIALGFLIALFASIHFGSFQAFLIVFIPLLMTGAIIYFIMRFSCATKILTLEYTRRILYTLQIDSLQEKIKQIDNKEVKS